MDYSEYAAIAVVFVCSLGATLIVTPGIRRMALRRRWVDDPDGLRKNHKAPTATLGGVGIAFGYLAGMAALHLLRPWLPFEVPASSPVLWGGALVMLLAGIYDDIKGLDFKAKFVIQVGVAYALLFAGYQIDVSGLPFMGDSPFQQALVSIPLTVFWVVAVINAVNLIDGLDGLAAGVSIIAFAYLGLIFSFQGGIVVVLPALMMVGALAGFLVYNFNPARIFMGDSGSLFLGFMLAAYSLEGQASLDPVLSFLTLVVVMGLPLLDTAFSIMRRLITGRAIFAPDHDHIHHRMMRRWSHRQAVLWLYAAATVFGMIAVFMAVASKPTGFLLFGLAVVLAFIGLVRLRSFRQPYAPPLLAEAPVKEERSSGEAGHHGDGHSGEHAVRAVADDPAPLEPVS